MTETIKPKWSISWLEGFKSYNNIRKRKQYSKATLVNMEGAEDHMVELRVIIAPYLLKDVYNINETELF